MRIRSRDQALSRVEITLSRSHRAIVFHRIKPRNQFSVIAKSHHTKKIILAFWMIRDPPSKLASGVQKLTHWLVQNTDRSVAQIAYECGFSDSTHFCKSFKKRFSISPARLRKQHREMGCV
ncbi:helix-turn-helix domain-containing protein [Pseudomonas asiatica]|uniref:helix-turn-helix domain-containing protein n=1 Tax=Pseudomonas asiatica TaxID=2219225 RepID=UPI000C244E21|nr:hypothetical protein CSW00_06840 [Pseudomonas sp. MR 02]